jgi:cell wall assembly regulator SMI1
VKKRFSLGSLSMESFDQAPTGNVNATGQPIGQPVNPEQPLVMAGYTESIPGGNTGNYAAETRIKAKDVLNAPAMESAAEHQAQELWDKLFKSHDVKSEAEIQEAFNLEPGASNSQIDKVSAYFHAKLPDLLVEVLKIHNGQPGWWRNTQSSGYEDIYPHFGIMLGTDDMMHVAKDFMNMRDDMDEWYGPIDTDPRMKPVQWSQHWLPLATSEDHKRAVTYVLDFDPAPSGTRGQVFKIEQSGNKRVHLGNNFDTWFPGLIQRHVSYMSLESRTTPRYPLKKALEADAVVIDDDELDALVSQANNLTKLCDNTAEIALEAASDLAKSKMHLRFKRLKDSFGDAFKSTGGMIVKYRQRLQELKHELSGTMVHGQLEVNMSGLWQHFSTEAGPVTSNLVGKVKEDVAFSHYLLMDFSQKAFDELKQLSAALHTGQGNSDEEAKRTALDVEKCSGPAEYMNQKWLCTASEQPYLSVTGIYGRQSNFPRPVAISGVSLDRLAQLSAHYYVREYGSFLHGMKKLFVHDSKKTTRLTESDLEQLIKLGEEYLVGAEHYLKLYHELWQVFHHVDDSLDQIWEDFDLTDYTVNLGDENDGDTYEVSWQTSGTGPIERRAKVFDQLMGVVRNFSDATIMPGFHEMARALRAAKYHGYIVAAGLKAAEKTQGDKVAQEIFGFGKKTPPKAAEYKAPDDKEVPAPSWNPQHPPSIAETFKAWKEFAQQNDPDSLKDLHKPATPQELQVLANLVKQHTGKALPPQLVELLKISNGGASSYRHLQFFAYEEFLSVQEIVKTYELYAHFIDGNDWADHDSSPKQGVKGKRYWEPWWIPFTSDGSGDGYCVDIDPGAGGSVGQVISWGHDYPSRSVRAPSIAAWFALNLHQQTYLHNHKKDWENKNAPKPQVKNASDDGDHEFR